MPEIFSEINEMTTHILEPITEQNIHQTLYQLGMTKKIDNRIYIDYGYSSIKSRTIRSLDANLRNNRVQCDVNINLLPQGAKIDNYTFTHAPSYGISKNSYSMFKPLVYDVKSNIRAFEQTMPVTITTTYTFSLVERSLAYGLAARIKNIYGDGNIYETKDVMFTYPFPTSMLNILYGLYKLKDTKNKLSYPQYLIDVSNGHITFSTNRTIQKTEVIVQRTNVEALSNYVYEDEKPTEQKSKKTTDSYELRLVHSFQLSLPNSLSMEYPIIIDNTPVPEQLVILNKSNPIKNLEQTGDILPWRRRQDNRLKMYKDPIKLPEYDDWIIPTQAKAKFYSYHEFFSAAFCLDETTKFQTFDILNDEEFSGYVFHPIVDHFLLLQGQESFNHDVLFNITIYKNNRPLDVEKCFMDHYGNISIDTQDTNKVHRLVISEITDLRYLNPKWLDELEDWMNKHCKDPASLCCPWLRAIDEYYNNPPGGKDPNIGPLRIMRFFFRACRPGITKPRDLVNHPNSVI